MHVVAMAVMLSALGLGLSAVVYDAFGPLSPGRVISVGVACMAAVICDRSPDTSPRFGVVQLLLAMAAMLTSVPWLEVIVAGARLKWLVVSVAFLWLLRVNNLARSRNALSSLGVAALPIIAGCAHLAGLSAYPVYLVTIAAACAGLVAERRYELLSPLAVLALALLAVPSGSSRALFYGAFGTSAAMLAFGAHFHDKGSHPWRN